MHCHVLQTFKVMVQFVDPCCFHLNIIMVYNKSNKNKTMKLQLIKQFVNDTSVFFVNESKQFLFDKLTPIQDFVLKLFTLF